MSNTCQIYDGVEWANCENETPKGVDICTKHLDPGEYNE